MNDAIATTVRKDLVLPSLHQTLNDLWQVYPDYASLRGGSLEEHVVVADAENSPVEAHELLLHGV